MPFWNKGHDSDPTQIVVAFETFKHLCHVSIRPATAISAMSSMHEDICTGAEAKRAAMVILPFHKHQRMDGHLETTREDYRHVNRRVLKNAPCSVAILVDRGLGGPAHVPASNVDYTITAFFFGGNDDCEALAYAMLMAEHPGVTLNAVRFVVHADTVGRSTQVDVDDGLGKPPADSRWDSENFILELKQRASNDESIKYQECVVSSDTEAVDAIRQHSKSSLFVVGRIPEGQLAAALDKKNDCPELGPIGNLLISPDFSTAASVLVVQQYRRKLTGISLKTLRGVESEGDYDSQ